MKADGGLDADLGDWDQFRANEAQYGVKSDYSEEFYTVGGLWWISGFLTVVLDCLLYTSPSPRDRG